MSMLGTCTMAATWINGFYDATYNLLLLFLICTSTMHVQCYLSPSTFLSVHIFQSYNLCTTAFEGDKRPWCPTELSVTGVHRLNSRHWRWKTIQYRDAYYKPRHYIRRNIVWELDYALVTATPVALSRTAILVRREAQHPNRGWGGQDPLEQQRHSAQVRAFVNTTSGNIYNSKHRYRIWHSAFHNGFNYDNGGADDGSNIHGVKSEFTQRHMVSRRN